MKHESSGRRSRKYGCVARSMLDAARSSSGSIVAEADDAFFRARMWRDRRLLRASPRATVEAFLEAYGSFELTMLDDVLGAESEHVRPFFAEWLQQMAAELELHDDGAGRFTRLL